MSRRHALLNEMGIGPVWTLRERSAVMEPAVDQAVAQADIPISEALSPETLGQNFSAETPLEKNVTVASDVANMRWEQLEAAIKSCENCGLCRGRTQAVPGVGDRNADWLFIGEGPGFYEDQQGEPFVGASGKLLDNMLAAIGLQRGKHAYIANVVKCRATDSAGKDRPPTVDEAQACHPYLERQIALIQPRIIVAIGRIAATTLLRTDPQTPLAVLRGKSHLYRTPDGRTIPLVATYHPAYLLRQLSEKRKAWEDLCLAMRAYSDTEQ